MARQALMRLTNEALRAKLTEANLDTTGTKVALVERLLQHEASYVQGSSGLRTTRPRGHANCQLTSSESEGDEDAANPSDVPSETPDAGAEGAAASVPEVPSGTSASGSEETSETPTITQRRRSRRTTDDAATGVGLPGLHSRRILRCVKTDYT